MICPKCQNEVKDGAKFCGSCGATVSAIEPHFCGKCGGKITDSEDKVCASCRAKERIVATPAAPMTPPPTPVVSPVQAPAPKKKSILPGLMVVGLALAVLVGGACYYLWGMGGLEQIQMSLLLAEEDVSTASEETVAPPETAAPSSVAPEEATTSSPASSEAAASASSAPVVPMDYQRQDWNLAIEQKKTQYKPVSVRFIPVPQATELSDMENGLARIKVGGEWGLLSDPENGWDAMGFQQIMPVSEEMAAVQLGDKWGYLHASLESAKEIPCIWDTAGSFSNGYAVVTKDKKYGLIDKTGKVIIEPYYDDMRAYADGMLPVCDTDKWGYVDLTDRARLPFVYEDAGPFASGVAVVVQEGRAFFIDQTGQKTTGDYDDAWSFNENHTAKVQVGDRFGLITTRGEYLVNPEWDNIWNLQEGVATVQRAGKYGYVSEDNTVAIEPTYKNVWSSSFGLIPVQFANNRWGYVDRQGNTVIEPQYSEAYNFSEGVGRVGKDGKYALIDLNGNTLTNYNYKIMGYVREGYCPVKDQNNQWGYLKITY